AEFLAAIGRDRHFVAQDAVLVVEYFQRAGILWLGRRAFIAAGYQDRQPVVRGHAHLMSEDARVDRAGLAHFLARREVLVDAVDAHSAWIVERHENEFGRYVRADVNGTRRQPYRRAVLAQRAGFRIDRERGDVMLGPLLAVTRRAAAGRDV